MFQESSVCSGVSQSSVASESSTRSTTSLQNLDFKIIVEPKTPQQDQVRFSVNGQRCSHLLIFTGHNTPLGPDNAGESGLDIRYKSMSRQRTV